ncbi:hypothetical protein B0A49_00621 [Cryomyces minteri]|uniref:Succinate--hydroxymethylglutarate CoA-transferase n=1 Tax=Cryomyces minteri TaxID=331657 RepID=A0A4V6WLA5_9PEZI|nr:hypothetical protein B0A49_00621 [Cryomyces minteri]
MFRSPALRRLRQLTSHFAHNIGSSQRLLPSPGARLFSTPVAGGKGGPLAGLRVLDLTRVLAVDYGADVIKVEQPGTGDDTRHWKVKGEDQKWKTDSPMSHYFASVNRNKRSITLDLKKKEALEILYELAKTSDVFIGNFVPGKMEQLGIGYGAEGPYANRAGYDAIAAAEAGLMHITGEAGGRPVRPGLGMVDMCTGLYTHGAILAALQARHSTGRGQKIDASLFETQIALLINVGAGWLNLGLDGQRYGAAHPSIVPYNTFETKNGYLAVGANNDRQFKVLAERIDRLDLLEEPRFCTNALRVENREAMDAIVNDIFKEKTIEEWLAVLDGSGLAHGPVNSIQKAFEHPQTRARDMIQAVECEAAEAGHINMIGVPVKFSETKGTIRARPPFLGEHTAEILQGIRYEAKRIEQLRKDGVV